MRNNIPAELRSLPQWVCSGENRVPINPRTGRAASVSDPTTWGTFEEACRTGFKHIGFVLAAWDPYSIIDLDNKVDNPVTEEEWQRHQKILSVFDSYTERSASGRGYHIIVRGKIPSGVHRDKVEVYSSARCMVCTGDVVRDTPITGYQELLDALYSEMRPTNSVELVDLEANQDDGEVVAMAMRASNADKFNALCAGDMSEYPSQSEADFALLSILAYYSQDNEQVRRLFRMSALGKRDKAIRNDTYLNFALGKIRAQQPPPVDMGALIANATAAMAPPKEEPPKPKKEPKKVKKELEERKEPSIDGIPLPPGLVGELAVYFYQAAIRPVPEIALAAALALTAGVCARSYNISGSGLNQYLILLAKTGSGKEGALSGIENLISAVRAQIPMVDQFIGPAAFASGQALVKVLNDKPCFVSVLGEFGLTLQQLSDQRANSAQLMLRKVLLDLYAKSGWNRMLRSSVYSDTDKNTKIIQAPNVTILGESTPETFFDGLDASHIAEGLIPRFSVIEYRGDRVPRNRNANVPPSAALAQRFIDLVAISLTTSNNNTCAPVQLDNHSMALLDEFDSHADSVMNASNLDVETQVWNRAHLKALKLAALLAVGCNPHQPIVTAEMAKWAINFVTRDVELVSARFKDGDVGQGDSKQFHDLKRAIEAYFNHPPKAVKDRYGSSAGGKHDLIKAGIIPYAHLSQRTASAASFRHDRLGATSALKRTIQTMLDSGMLVEISRPLLLQKYKFSGVAYGISTSWS